MSTSAKPAVEVSATARSVNPALFRVEPRDVELFNTRLRSFVPPNSFDAHAHLFDLSMLSPGTPADAFGGPTAVGRDTFLRCQTAWMGDRRLGDGLFFPFPRKGLDSNWSNGFLADELSKPAAGGCRGLMIVTPRDDPAAIESQIRQHRWAGFKVYHVYADRPDTFNADQGEFLPEWAWELAQQYGLWITMHMVLDRAIADPRNQNYIRTHCIKYSNARMVLAHAARGFCAGHTIEGVGSLRGLPNIYFDTSAVCEPGAFSAILEAFGPTRLMFGSDFPVSEMRGRAVSVNDGFYWMYEDNVKWEGWTLGRHTLVGIESLLALQQACRDQRLTDADVERIFSTNARQLLGLEKPPVGDHVQALYREAKKLIPGGTQLLSKRPEMFAPEQWPAYYDQAIGCEVVDADGRRFLDFSYCGILACILGYADPDVNAAVIRRVRMGSMATLQTADEVELAKLLLEIHPWAAMARFARTGGEAMAVAVRIARAATGRDKVAVCGYHGWHDWYLAANLAATDETGRRTLDGHLLPGLEPRGVPRGLAGTTLTFRYNHLDDLDRVLANHAKDMAAIVMEPTRMTDPAPGFLQGVRQRADQHGIKLVFDEISIGWRLCLGGAHLKFGVAPDIAVFAKTLSNGYAMSAVIGRADPMQAAQDSFISSAYWTEAIGPAAAVASVRKMMRIDVRSHIARIGRRVEEGWTALAARHTLPLKLTGRPELPGFTFATPDPAAAAALLTLFIARMLRRGFLASAGFAPMLAHEDHHVDAYLAATNEAFAELAAAIKADDVLKRIGGPVKHSGFARLT